MIEFMFPSFWVPYITKVIIFCDTIHAQWLDDFINSTIFVSLFLLIICE
jgi:hypothetical protein